MTDATPKKTAITICGSLSADSINEIFRRHMSQKLREAGVEVTDLDMHDYPMPIFDLDIEKGALWWLVGNPGAPKPRLRLAIAPDML